MRAVLSCVVCELVSAGARAQRGFGRYTAQHPAASTRGHGAEFSM